jgi:hypothetical protein
LATRTGKPPNREQELLTACAIYLRGRALAAARKKELPPEER